MIIFLYGEDTFRSKKRLKQLISAYTKKYDNTALSIVKLDGENLDINEFRKHLLSHGLLTKKNLIIIRNLITKAPSKISEAVEKELKDRSLSSDNILIFWEEGKGQGLSKKNGNLFELLSSGKEAKEFELLSPAALLKWIDNEVKDQKGQIDEKGKRALVLSCGNDLWLVSTEINKLVNYKRGETIKEEDVTFLVKTQYDPNIFHLTDALALKNKEITLRLIEEQLAQGTDKLELLSRLIWQFRTLLKVKDAQKDRVPEMRIARDVGVHPYVAQKAYGQVKKFSYEELKNIYEKLLEIDYKIKTGQGEALVLFDLLVASLV